MRRHRPAYHRHKPSGVARWLPRLIFIVFLFIIISRWWSDEREKPRVTPGGSPTPQAAPEARALDEAERQRLVESLKPPADVELKDGVAVAIVIDTSGSMNESVPGKGGDRVRKIEAARTAVAALVETTQRLAQERTERPVVLALYEFSSRSGNDNVRQVLPFGPPDPAAAAQAVAAMDPNGGTPISEAILVAKRDLDATGMIRQHILLVTDGQNTTGHDPAAIVKLLYDPAHNLPPAAIYFVAFDIAASTFDSSREAGAAILSASDEAQLRTTLDQIMADRILVE